MVQLFSAEVADLRKLIQDTNAAIVADTTEKLTEIKEVFVPKKIKEVKDFIQDDFNELRTEFSDLKSYT